MADQKAGKTALGAAHTLFARGAHRLSRSPAGKRLLDVVSRSVTIQRLTLGGPNPIRAWDDDPQFQALLVDVRRLSLNRPPSLFNLYQLASAVRHLPGDIAEVGVYKGGTGRLLAQVFAGTGKKIFLFDTFTGMPDAIDPMVEDWKPGDFADTSLQAVRAAVAQWPEVSCVPGRFPETADAVAGRRFCLAHVDVDIQQSVRDCCDFFYPRLVPGGMLVFDDYGFRSCVGARRAVDDFFADKPERVLYLPTGQGVVIRSPRPDDAALATTAAAEAHGD
jgi:O-methyltransferase